MEVHIFSKDPDRPQRIYSVLFDELYCGVPATNLSRKWCWRLFNLKIDVTLLVCLHFTLYSDNIRHFTAS